jgi:hypothetical protein
MSWDVQVPFLSEMSFEVFRCLVCRRRLFSLGRYEFAVSGAGDDYIELANTYPFVEAQIMDDDDTALDGGADVGSVNLLMSGLFSLGRSF